MRSAAGIVAGAAFFVFFGSCTARPPDPTRVAVSAVNPHRDEARGILESRCGSCHRADLPTAQGAALRVFDLTSLKWEETMSIRQLWSAYDRLEGQAAPREEIVTFGSFVEAEINLRVASPPIQQK
ncbi:MAG: hypothetical protein HYY84_19140 [Deltaproteobacteria bacterium]|nr:hypothetical protein [Deltaproteobacteria bacterium]